MRSSGEGQGSAEPRERHRLLLALGHGGMGSVYLAVSAGPAGFSKLKVVKFLRDEVAEDPRFLDMFLAEARLAAHLHHPNVVQTNDVGFDGLHYFIEMEFLDGQSFAAVQRRAWAGGAPLPVDLGAWILSQVLAGLHYAHELRDASNKPREIVHRDVSPQNVFVTYDGEVKILDFGIAKAADRRGETRTGLVKGKLSYMAPEQAAGRRVDRRADVFAVGIMLWETLMGHRMWGEAVDREIMDALERGQLPPLQGDRGSRPPELEAICARALACNLEQRYATAEEMQLALDAYLDRRPARVGARQLGTIARELFAERRAAVRAEIDEQLRAGSAAPRKTVDVPALGYSRAYGITPSVELGATRDVSPNELAKQEAPSPNRSAAADRPKETEALPATTPEGRERTPKGPRRRRLSVSSSVWRASIAVTLGLTAVSTFVLWRARGAGRSADGPDGAPSAPGNAPPSFACSNAEQCVDHAAGRPSVCRQHRCVDVEQHGCRASIEDRDLRRDDVLWVGAIVDSTNTNAVDLARRDIMSVSDGIPRVGDPRGPQPVAAVMCTDRTQTMKAARFLAEELAVPAVIGFNTSKEAVDLISNVFLPDRIMVLVSTTPGEQVLKVPQPADAPRLLWRTTYDDAQLVPILAAVVARLESRVRERPFRVALVRRDTPSGLVFGERLFRTITFNGRSALDNEANYHPFVIGDGEGRFEQALNRLAEMRPNVIIYGGGLDPDIYPSLFQELEARWPRDHAARPYYVSVESLDSAALRSFVDGDAGVRRRFLGLQFVSQIAGNADLVFHYNQTFSDAVSLAESPNTSYDAFFLAVLAAAASRQERPTGVALAAAMQRFTTPGRAVEFGPSRAQDAFSALRDPGPITLVGTSGKLAFDGATGEWPAPFEVDCLSADGSGRAGGAVGSGATWDVSKGLLVGDMRCP